MLHLYRYLLFVLLILYFLLLEIYQLQRSYFCSSNYYYYNYYYYNGTTTAISQNPNAYGHYWTSTHINSDPEHQTDMKAFAVYFDNSCIKIQDENTTLYQNRMNRNRGCCVRLVWDANPN